MRRLVLPGFERVETDPSDPSLGSPMEKKGPHAGFGVGSEQYKGASGITRCMQSRGAGL